jgi:hypothetical protein
VRTQARESSGFSTRYHVEVTIEDGELVCTVVAPSGARLYSYADATAAQREADALNRVRHRTPEAGAGV